MADVFTQSKGGTVNWASGGDDIRVLLTYGYAFDADHDYLNDVVADEMTGTGYARKKTYNRTVSQVVASDKLQHDCDDTTWTGINAGSADGAIYFINNASDSLAQLISYNDFAEVYTNGGDLTINVDADGVYEGIPA